MCKSCVFQAQNSNWSIVGQQERAGNISLVGIQGFKLFGIWGSSNCSGSEAVWDPGSLSLFEVWEPQPVQDLGTFSPFRIHGASVCLGSRDIQPTQGLWRPRDSTTSPRGPEFPVPPRWCL